MITCCFTWWNIRVIYGCFLKRWCPQNTPNWSYLVGKPVVVGHWWISGLATIAYIVVFSANLCTENIFLFWMTINIKPPQFLSLSLDLSNMIIWPAAIAVQVKARNSPFGGIFVPKLELFQFEAETKQQIQQANSIYPKILNARWWFPSRFSMFFPNGGVGGHLGPPPKRGRTRRIARFLSFLLFFHVSGFKR